MNPKNFFFFFLFLILLSSFVCADKITINEFRSDTGLNILESETLFYEQNNDFDLVFKVFDSNGSKDISASCSITLVDDEGVRLKDNESLVFNAVSESFVVSVTEVDVQGLYSFFISCEGSNEDGFLQSGFYGSPDGFDMRLVGEFDYLTVILILFFICFMSLFISNMFVSKEFFVFKLIFFIWGVLQVLLVLPIFLLTMSSYGSPTAMFDWFVVYFTIDVFLLIIFVWGYWMIVGKSMIMHFTKMAKRKKEKPIKYM